MSKAAFTAVPAVSLLYGKKAREDLFDDYLAGEHLARMKRALGGESLSVSEYDAAQRDLADCLDELATPAMWGAARLVVLLSAEALLSPPAPERSRVEPILKRLTQFARAKPASGFLALVASALDLSRAGAPALSFPAAQALVDAIDAAGGLVSCVPPYETSLKQALIKRAAANAVRLLPAAADALLRIVGTDQMSLQEELDKLVAAAGEDKTIAPRDVEAVAASRPQATVFSLADKILDADVPGALTDLRSLRETPATRSAPFILSNLSMSLRRCLAASDLVARGKSPQAAAAAVGVPAFFQRDFAARLRKWSCESILALLERCLACDVQVKTGAVSDEIALECFVADACARRLSSPELVGRWLYEI